MLSVTHSFWHVILYCPTQLLLLAVLACISDYYERQHDVTNKCSYTSKNSEYLCALLQTSLTLRRERWHPSLLPHKYRSVAFSRGSKNNSKNRILEYTCIKINGHPFLLQLENGSTNLNTIFLFGSPQYWFRNKACETVARS